MAIFNSQLLVYQRVNLHVPMVFLWVFPLIHHPIWYGDPLQVPGSQTRLLTRRKVVDFKLLDFLTSYGDSYRLFRGSHGDIWYVNILVCIICSSLHIFMFTYMYMYMYVHLCICLCLCLCMYIYIYIILLRRCHQYSSTISGWLHSLGATEGSPK